MKLLSIFKKEVKTNSAKVEKLENKKLGAIIGGNSTIGTETPADPTIPVSGKGISEKGIK